MASGHDSVSEVDEFAQRHAITVLEKYERFESQELLAQASSHWLLSTEDYKIRIEPPSGLISKMMPVSGFLYNVLMPVDEYLDALDLREVHQIIKELTVGIYVMNQVPNIHLEANFDQSTSCQLPPAYIDTRVGQTLINVDYMLKAMWHGVYFSKEKRTKFGDRWRQQFDVDEHGKPQTKKPLITDFLQEGLADIAKESDYAGLYDDLPGGQPRDKSHEEETRFFMQHINDVSLRLTFHQNSVQQYKNMFIVDADWSVGSVVHLMNEQLDSEGYERLYSQLQLHELLIQENLARKTDIHKNLYMLKLISFLVPWLVSMRKVMKIPDIQHLLPNMTGDDIKTEREFPPLMIPEGTTCPIFSFGKRYFHLHGGILIDLETDPPIPAAPEMVVVYDSLQKDAAQLLSRWLDPSAPPQDLYYLPVTSIEGKNYYNIGIEFETYYPQSPQKPRWVNALAEEAHTMRYKRLPMQDSQLHDMFKHYFGIRQAIKFKNLQNGLRAAACRGLVGAFMTLCRKCQVSRLSKPYETGLTLMHYAAMYNRPHIIAILILQGVDVNIRRSNSLANSEGPGVTPLHVAAKCGSLDAAACLLANYANVIATDQDNWAPIHYAAYFNHEHIIRMLIRKNDALLELQTKNELRLTPLLLAASSGALAAVKCLIDLGAYILRKDSHNNNVIHLAALRFHTNVLEFFMQWDHHDVPVWLILVGMLKDNDEQKQDAAVKCLEIMSMSKEHHWKFILQAGGVPALVELLKHENREVRSVTAAVLCNISQHGPVRHALLEANAGPILISLLSPNEAGETNFDTDDLHSRAAIVLSDLASVENNQGALAGAIPPLVNLLNSSMEDVLVNAVNALRIMCTDNRENQAAVAQHGAIEHLVEFLTIDSEKLQAGAAAAIAALAADNDENKYRIIEEGAAEPLVALLRGFIVEVQAKAAGALESLCLHNPDCQRVFLQLDATKALMKLFIKVWSVEVKEQTACAMWALAGHTHRQQKEITQKIGIAHLTDMLLSASDKLQYVGCMGMTALSREDMDNQNKIAEQGSLVPLVRLLRSPKTTSNVLLAVIKTLATLCVGLAHHNNKVTQDKIAEEGALFYLVELLANPPSEEIQVEVAYTLGCLVLGNQHNQAKMLQAPNFRYERVLDLLNLEDKRLRLKAGLAVAIFAFNNTSQQLAFREAGGISYNGFQYFLQAEDESSQCYAAFQIVVLARVIVDMDQVSLTALGVTQLVTILRSPDDNAVILAASLLSSLAHSRAGITDAMLTVGAVEELLSRLKNPNIQVRFACAVTLGYLTFNRTAARKMLVAVRNNPGLYDLMMQNMGTHPRICRDFTEEYHTHKLIGIPSLSLEIHGGPPCDPYKKSAGTRVRPKTTQDVTQRRKHHKDADRSISAPVAVMTVQSAASNRIKSAGSITARSAVSQASSTQSTTFKSRLSAWHKK